MLTQYHKKFELFIKNPGRAGQKLLISFLLSLLLMFIKKISILFALDIFLLLILIISGAGWKWLTKIIFFTVLSSFFIFMAHLLQHNVWQGVQVFLRLLFMVLLSAFLIITTREMDFIYAIEKILKAVRIPYKQIERISFFCFLTLSSISVISAQYKEIRMAQKARGLENNIFAIIMPLLIKMFRSADAMAEALVARGYDDL